MGRWKVNEEKTDRGIALTFEPTDSGDLRLMEGGRTTIVRFDGKEYPHPLGGVVRWTRIDDRTFETIYSQNGKVLGDAIYQLSDDGQTLTTRMKGVADAPAVYRRRSAAGKGLAGAWSLKTASVSTLEFAVVDGYDMVFTSGGASCKANFDGRDYPIIEPGGKPSTFEACRISKAGERGVSISVVINGKPVAVNTYTASGDARTLTETGGPVGQPQSSTVVYDRQ